MPDGEEALVEASPASHPVSKPVSKPPASKPPLSKPVSKPPLSKPAPLFDAETETRRRALGGRSAISVDHIPPSARHVDAVNLAGRAVPRITKTKPEIAAAPIDHRAGFLLAHIDGKTSVQGLVDIAGMPEDEVHETLERLRRLGIVAIR